MMQRYESYKLSGIQWVEQIPSEWSTERAKWVFKRMERPVQPEDDVVTAFRDGQVTLRKNRRTEGFTNAIHEHGYQGIRKGDLVIHAMDAFAGAIGVSDSDGKSTPVYAACVPTTEFNANSYYYAYLVRYMAHSGYIQSLSKGIRERSTDFRFSEFRELPLPIPPRNEQDRVVRFLDLKTAEIDTAIEKKERLIKLLQEQKGILINQAVTRGLNPNVPMRESGVDWIGEVPAHWQERRLKMLSSFITSGPRGWSEILTDEGAIFLQSGNLNNSLGVDIAKAHRVVVPKGAEAKRTRLMDNDIVICITGANTGRVAVADIDGQEAYINQHLSLIRLKESNPRFVAYSLSSQGRTYFHLCQYGLKEGLSLFNVANAPIVLPPISEQEKIISFLDQVVEQVDAAVAAVIRQCERLRELKSSVIAASVTGQIQH